MENILEIKNVTKNYGKFQALDNISFSVPNGSITGLLGPNGSGKTTIIKIITGLLANYNGTVKIGGFDPGYKANALISYLPDKEHLPDWFTVNESVKFFSDFYSDFDKPKSIQMLESLKIPMEKPIRALSKGMKEKLQLSLIMSRQAKLYILDEPIAAVDPASRDFIMKTILGNCAQGSSILISTHIISDIEPALDNVIFLKEGKIFLEDHVDNIRLKNKSVDELFREVFKC